MARWAALTGVVMAVVVMMVNADDFEADPVELDNTSMEATGRTLYEWGQELLQWMGFGDDYDDYDYDYDYQLYYPSGSAQIGYGLPSVGYAPSASGGAAQGHYSSYSSYSPYPVVPQHHQFYNARKDDYEDSSWSLGDMVMGAAAVAAPFILLASAMPTSLLTVAVRRRSFDDGSDLAAEVDPSELPLLNTILEAKDFTALLSPHCQRKLFCEITKIGENEEASFMQRAFYYLAMLTPDRLARRVGLARTFRAARNGECAALACGSDFLSSLAPPAALPPSNHLPEEYSSSSNSSSPDSEE